MRARVSLTSLFGDDGEILRETDFQLLMLASVLPALGLALASPILESLIDPFGTTTADIGLMISMFTAPAMVMIPIAGVLADTFGRKGVLVTSLVVFGVGGTTIAFTTDYHVVLGLRLLQGVGFGGLVPVIISSIGDLYSGEREATGQGFRFMVAGVSGALFPLVAGVLVTVAWFYPFLLYSLAIPIAGVLYLWFDEPTAAASSGRDTGVDGDSYAGALFQLLRRRRVLSMVVARTLFTGIWIGLLTYNSLIVVRVIGGSPPEAGLLVSIGYFVFAVTASQAGRVTSAFESQLLVLVGANILLGAGFLVVLFAPRVVVAFAGVTVSGIGMGILGSLYRSIITGLAPVELRAGIVSLSEMGGQLTNTVTPALMGGVVGLTAPAVGLGAAIQLAGVGVVIVVSGGSIACLIVASVSPSLAAEDTDTSAT